VVGPFDRRQSFDAFVVGRSNRLAHAAAVAVAENDRSAYNPLFIHGPAGNGKTHLLHAIGLYVQEHSPHLAIRYTMCEGFTNEFIDAIRGNGRAAFCQRYRRCHLLLVDDVQFLEGREGTQEEFFHTFNEVVAGGGRVVLTSDRHPGDLSMLPDRLRSRFKSGLLSDLQAPEPATRLAILRKKAEAHGVAVPDQVLEYLAETVSSNVRELEGALTRLCATASLEDKPLTLVLAHATVASFLGSAASRPLTLERIIEEAAVVFAVPVAELTGPARTRTLVSARQAAMYVCRARTNESLPSIARAFNKHDHTTVIHAVRKVEDLMGQRAPLYFQVVELMDRLGPDRRG
jgi:chromosomal replication initiator protein